MSINLILGVHYSTILVVCSLNTIPLTYGDDGSGRLRACTEGKTYRIEAGGCPRGVTLHKPLRLNCVCVNGVWALSKGGCDDSAFLLVGRGHEDCFGVNADIDTFKYLGKPSDPFSPAEYVGTSFLSVFWKMPSGKGSKDHRELNGSVAMISVNSDNAVEARGSSCCRAGFGNAKAVRICMSGPGKYYKSGSWCSTGSPQGPYTFELDYGEGVQLIQSDSPVKSRSWDRSTLLKLDPCGKSCISTIPDYRTDCCNSFDFEDVDEEAAVDLKRINDQTGRIASRLLKLKLWKKKGAKVEHPEYVYLKTAKKILSKLCPKKVLSTYLLDSVMNLFRFLLVETMDKYPFVKRFEPKRHKRILGALSQCRKSAGEDKPIEIVWTKPGTCPLKVESITAYKEKSPTVFGMSDMPLNHTFDYLTYDFPLEAVWKIMSFTHYYCASHFSKYPTDHSQLMISLESLFNEELMKRWANPGRSYPVMKRIFNMYQLPQFAMGLDACVTGAKMTSEYTKWVTRPLLRRFGPSPVDRKPSPVFDDMGLCLESYWDSDSKGTEGLKQHPITKATCFPAYNMFYQI